jgi:hypothetical protein
MEWTAINPKPEKAAGCSAPNQALVKGAQMYCEKYSATIPVSTCIARQEAARRQRPFWIGRGDPGCRNCSQGCQVMRDFHLWRVRAMVAAAVVGGREALPARA